jgi:hypothetical protein
MVYQTLVYISEYLSEVVAYINVLHVIPYPRDN